MTCEPDTTAILALHPDPLVRAGVVASLRRHTDFEIIEAQGDTRPEALDLPSSVVVIVDHAQAMRATQPAAPARRLPPARVLVLTANDREADIRRAVEAGIDGYVLIGGPLSDLVDAVKALAAGGRYFSRTVAQRIADSIARVTLTSREFDVLQWVVLGETNKGIARRLGIEVGTVKSHMNGIMSKLNATSRTQAAAIAIAKGLVEEPTLVPSPLLAGRPARRAALRITN